ncbi:BnaC03g48200D [Brassica napus]|uniref:BnaC03g48200D protein n=1 Tax=Brassica napus TaxID=3708 RepID=A0A078F3Y8_BRANA|nr:BnaC03g48200D [Brassica napus]
MCLVLGKRGRGRGPKH